MSTGLELRDIQGLLRHGYPYFHDAIYCLFTIEDVPRFGDWLEVLRDGWIDEAYDRKVKVEGENFGAAVAFTASGMRKLGLDADAMRTFPSEFQEGMVAPYRARLLGDSGASAPGEWDWGGPAGSKSVVTDDDLHGVVIVFALDMKQIEQRMKALQPIPREILDERVEALRRISGCPEFVYRIRTHLEVDENKVSKEPFGFADGLSQPYIEGLTLKKAPAGVRPIKAGEFVLGYPNEVNRLPASPLVPGGGPLPIDQATGRGDLGRNGSFLVMRQLEQNVDEFRKIAASEELAAKMVGRWKSGEPLVRQPTDPAEKPTGSALVRHRPRRQTTTEFEAENDFGYHKEDRAGFRCPIGSHIRRANPRDALADGLGVSPDYARQLADRHRILRRGRVYKQEDKTGLVFVCLNANIERQFEFVQSAWLLNPEFGGLNEETDPILGTGGKFTLQKPVLGQCVTGLTQFVTVKGGAYFFLPGHSALGYLADLSRQQPPPQHLPAPSAPPP
jgi:Dyp-type peroxidase family